MVACCAEKTYAETTIADLVSRAGVSRTTFYKLFTDKRDCFDAAVTRCIERLGATLAKAADGCDSPAEATRRATIAGLEMLAAEPALALVLSGDVVGVDPRRVDRYGQLAIPAVESLWMRAGEQPRKHSSPGLAFGRAQLLVFHEVAAGRPDHLPDAGARHRLPGDGPVRRARGGAAAGAVGGGVGDGGGVSAPASARLPRGRHGLSRADVARSQRERLVAATAQVTAERGYEATTVADILTASGVGRESFYEIFQRPPRLRPRRPPEVARRPDRQGRGRIRRRRRLGRALPGHPRRAARLVRRRPPGRALPVGRGGRGRPRVPLPLRGRLRPLRRDHRLRTTRRPPRPWGRCRRPASPSAPRSPASTSRSPPVAPKSCPGCCRSSPTRSWSRSSAKTPPARRRSRRCSEEADRRPPASGLRPSEMGRPCRVASREGDSGRSGFGRLRRRRGRATLPRRPRGSHPLAGSRP